MRARSYQDGPVPPSGRLGRWLYRALELSAVNAAVWVTVDPRLTAEVCEPAPSRPAPAGGPDWLRTWLEITSQLADIDQLA